MVVNLTICPQQALIQMLVDISVGPHEVNLLLVHLVGVVGLAHLVVLLPHRAQTQPVDVHFKVAPVVVVVET
jgi:hypothetical protein